MKGSTYHQTWDATMAANRLQKAVNIGLGIAVLLLAFAVVFKDKTVVLVPPTLEQSGAMSKSQASEEIKVSWGLYLATLFGNVTPKTVGFLSERVGMHLSPAMYRPVLQALEQQSQEIQNENLSISFAPSLARWEPTSQRVVVTGELVTRGVNDTAKRVIRTYELAFVTQNYRVLLDDLRVYEGSWRREPTQEE